MTLAIGQSMKKDECNMCTCQSNGQVSCTNKPCSCMYNGNTYPITNTFMQPDGCTRCRCNENGQVTCDKSGCPPAIKAVCRHMGTTYDIGATFKKECIPVAANKVLAAPASSHAPRKRADAESHVPDEFTRPANNGSLTSAPLAHANKRHLATLHPAERTLDAKCRERWKKEEHERTY